jgi:ABC-type bacteriocin/lantibiotic exporter with double-glycine peptidase domain
MRSVPPYSQHLHIHDPYWKDKSCGVVSLAMLIGYFQKEATPDEVLKLAIEKNAYLPGIGWKHRELADLAEKYNLLGNCYDWSNIDENTAIKNAENHIEKHPIMASVFSDFQPLNGGHLIVVTKIEANQVFYNDPNAKHEKDIKKTISKEKFIVGWKKRIITIKP